jgi:hypothetical protein
MQGNAVYFGSDLPLREPLKLKAGPISLLYNDGMIRSVRYGETEVVRRIYTALRDRFWNTIPGEIVEFDIRKNSDSFHIEFACMMNKNPINFKWNGTIDGLEDGTILFEIKTEALSDFEYNRIGFCVLHPLEICAGRPCKIERIDGSIKNVSFPVFIEPHQPFTNIRALTYKVLPQVEATLRFEGDTYEMEDQRNWTDASFKTYCPPLKDDLPLIIEKGTKFRQAIKLSIEQFSPPTVINRKPLEVQVSSSSFSHQLPDIGISIGTKQSLTPEASEKLSLLYLSHIRIDLDPGNDDFISDIEAASDICTRLTVPSELALHLTSIQDSELDMIFRALRTSQIPVRRFIIYKKDETTTSAETILAMKPFLKSYAPAAEICSGTDGYFVNINRSHPPANILDTVCYSATPQVHTFDNDSIMENLPGFAETLRSAHLFLCNAQPVISPITLRPRLRPDLPEKAGGYDSRQKGLFCAAWTLGNLMYCIEGGVHSLTYFEASGPGGLMPQDGNSVYPVYHVFAALGEMTGAGVQSCLCSDNYKISCLVLKRSITTVLLLANLTDSPQQVTVFDLPQTIHYMSLDEISFDEATNYPLQWRCRKGDTVSSTGPIHVFNLLPYGVVRVEAMWPE